jgi:DNA-binding phage protein
MVRKTRTSRYDIAEHLRTREEMAAYLEKTKTYASVSTYVPAVSA